jgi:secreted Zn-dependent insulinase-like peptidase
MAGFWAVSPNGNEIHINGYPDMSKETLNKLLAVMDAATSQYNRQREVFEQLWQSSDHRIMNLIDKDDAFEWFRNGCEWQIQKEKESDGQGNISEGIQGTMGLVQREKE